MIKLSYILMGNGFMLLTGGYGFEGVGGVGVYHPPFDTLKMSTSTYDMKLKLYNRGVQYGGIRYS